MFPLCWGSLSVSWKSFCWNILCQSRKYIVTALWFHTAWEVKAEVTGQECLGNSRITFTVKDMGGHKPQLVYWQGELSVFEVRILASLSSAIYWCRCSELAYLPHSEKQTTTKLVSLENTSAVTACLGALWVLSRSQHLSAQLLIVAQHFLVLLERFVSLEWFLFKGE